MEKDRNHHTMKQIMTESLQQMPFSDFEDRVMDQIEKEEARKRIWMRHLRLSWVFFIIGSFFGIGLSVYVSYLAPSLPGINPDYVTLLIQIIIIAVVALNLESMIRYTREKMYSNTRD